MEGVKVTFLGQLPESSSEKLTMKVGPERYCSPRHRVLFYLRNVVANRASMTWRAILTCP
jgi:hypothetical protein